MIKNILKLMTDHKPPIQEAQRMPSKINPPPNKNKNKNK